MQVIERKENFSGSRLWVSATGSAFMDGFVLTSQGFIFLLAQSVFFLAISSCQERLSRSKIASDMIGFQPGFFTLTHHSYFVTSGCSVNAARQREEFLPIA